MSELFWVGLGALLIGLPIGIVWGQKIGVRRYRALRTLQRERLGIGPLR